MAKKQVAEVSLPDDELGTDNIESQSTDDLKLALKAEKELVVVVDPPADVQEKVYVCTKKQCIAHQGGIVTLHVGTVISDAKFGEGAIERLRNAGVQMTLKA